LALLEVTLKTEVNQPPDYYFKAYFSHRYLAHFIHKRRVDKIVSFIPDGSFVLDAGCGSGIVPFLLAQRKACRGVGIDIRGECIEFAASKVPNFKFFPGDVRDFSLAERFDIVLCMEVLEHFVPADQARALNCLNSHLNPGGLLILTFPSRLYISIEPLWKKTRQLLHRNTVFDDDEYHSLISPESLSRLLKERGYSLERSLLSSFGLIQMIVMMKKKDGA
jgi:2-polyprenyl-3-methyl-5-hydroxy-6-metoxy-1,4-benzoquinol methylase